MLSGLLVGALRLTWPMLAVAWLCHLSFLAIGGPFLSFQWDALLSELGMLALLSVPIRWRQPQPLVLVALGRWLLLWLLIRLQFGSGWVKLAAGDPTWRNLTALHHHFETQPLPTVLGYYAHALPGVIKKALVVFTLITETLLPMFILVPRWHRLVLWPMLGLQLGILLTGNYGYFNLEVLVLLPPRVPPVMCHNCAITGALRVRMPLLCRVSPGPLKVTLPRL